MPQLLVNTLISSSILVLIGIGFAIIYRVGRFFHFAHGAILTCGAYSTFLFNIWLKIPLIISIALGVVSCILVGLIIEFVVYRPLRKKKSHTLIFLLASLGVYIIMQNIFSLVFGDGTRSIRTWEVKEGIDIMGGKITHVQILIVSVCILVITFVFFLLKSTKIGLAMNAIASSPDLAEFSGINISSIYLSTLLISSALAGIAGILIALDIDMTPTMGMNALMLGVVAVIIGGSKNIIGVVFGAIIISFAQHLTAWKVSSLWQEVVVFVILIGFLLIKPRGILSDNKYI
jgi:branched-chain amino acid transport system permease protein